MKLIKSGKREVMRMALLLIALGGVGLYGGKMEHRVAKIAEASGISYCKNSSTLMVVGDEGDIYEVGVNGKILSKHHLGDFDLEGVVCEDDRAIVAEENGYILNVDRKSFRFERVKVSGKDFKFSKKSGIEGIAKISNNRYILAIQSKKRKKAKLLIIKLKEKRAKISKIIKHGIIDSAGLEYRDNLLYIVSDKKDKLYIYDLKERKVMKKIELPKFAQEGITFDREGNVYFADDDGGVFKYREKELDIMLKKKD